MMVAGDVAIITGASSGIGRATAIALAREGLCLGVLGRSAEALARLAGEAAELGARAVHPVVCDVREESSVERAVRQIESMFGRVDILINSAGLSLNGEVDGYALEDWRTVIETNLTGTFLTCRAVLPGMKRRRAGQIINISSGAGRNGIARMAAYCASKFGVIGFTESLGLEVRNLNIRVAALLPGSVATDFSRVARREGPSPAIDAPEAAGRDIGYAMLPEEVASVILAMLEQPPQAWMSEVILRPLNTELRRTDP